jgi:hypothetical protein
MPPTRPMFCTEQAWGHNRSNIKMRRTCLFDSLRKRDGIFYWLLLASEQLPVWRFRSPHSSCSGRCCLQPLVDQGVRRIRVQGHERVADHQKARRAVPALERKPFDKAFVWVYFGGPSTVVICFPSASAVQHEAGLDRQAVDEHRARAAVAVVDIPGFAPVSASSFRSVSAGCRRAG